MKTAYPVTAEIVEWLNQHLVPIEASVFHHYRGIIHLVRLVDRAERGAIAKYAALSALREYNDTHRTSITYEEVRDRSPSYVMSDIGEWAAYVDSPEATNAIVSGAHDDPMEALTHADPEIKWIVLWLPQDDVAVVVRSPHFGYLDAFDDEAHIANGVKVGPYEAPTLPPDLVASLGKYSPDEILGGGHA